MTHKLIPGQRYLIHFSTPILGFPHQVMELECTWDQGGAEIEFRFETRRFAVLRGLIIAYELLGEPPKEKEDEVPSDDEIGEEWKRL